MPRYDYRCRTCGATFEITRPMREADAPTPCPAGHAETTKLLSTIAIGGSANAPAPAGGCCGGACGCG